MRQEPIVVVIVSAGRSGSKFLRDLLGAAEQCKVVPYDVNFVWRHGNEWREDDELLPTDISERQRAWIRTRILGLAGRRKETAPSVLIEKTVSNSLRVPFVRSVFPEARIVHLIRDGRAVAESARRVWNERPDPGYSFRKLRYLSPGDLGYLTKYAVNQFRRGGEGRSRRSWGPRYRGIDRDLASMSLLEVCARQWKACVSHSTEAVSSLSGPKLTLYYEELVRMPSKVEEICRFAGIADIVSVEEAWKLRKDAGNADKWRASLKPEEQELLASVLNPELKRLGYPLEEP